VRVSNRFQYASNYEKNVLLLILHYFFLSLEILFLFLFSCSRGKNQPMFSYELWLVISVLLGVSL
jgi:hypothetical protein